jgi:hypothetical protein
MDGKLMADIHLTALLWQLESSWMPLFGEASFTAFYALDTVLRVLRFIVKQQKNSHKAFSLCFHHFLSFYYKCEMK